MFDSVFEVHACELECGYWDFEFEGEFEIVDCSDITYGCTDSNALNYDANATVNDGSCEYDVEEECDCDWETEDYVCVSWFDSVFEVHVCELECEFWQFGFEDDYEIVDCEDVVYGCTDPDALNFDGNATINDGSCEYEWIDECDCDWTTDEYVCVSMFDSVFEVHACELECGYWDFEFDGEFEVVDCADIIYGCTDSTALNYDASATANDGSCEYDVEEECDCDWTSDEFICVAFDDQIITVHECELECGFWGEDFFDEEVEIVDCDWNGGFDSIEDEIAEVLEDFYGGGQFNQDNFQDLADILLDLFVYPNPLEDGDGLGLVINSNSGANASIMVVNSIGQTVYSQKEVLNKGKNTFELNVSELESGLYFAIVSADNGVSATEKFIKN